MHINYILAARLRSILFCPPPALMPRIEKRENGTAAAAILDVTGLERRWLCGISTAQQISAPFDPRLLQPLYTHTYKREAGDIYIRSAVNGQHASIRVKNQADKFPGQHKSLLFRLSRRIYYYTFPAVVHSTASHHLGQGPPCCTKETKVVGVSCFVAWRPVDRKEPARFCCCYIFARD